MNVEIKRVRDNWVLGHFGRRLEEHMPDFDGSGRKIIFYNIYNIVPDKVGDEIQVAYFTHNSYDGEFERFAKKVDYCICQAPQYERYLRSIGIENVKTIPMPPDSIYKPKLILLWVGHFFWARRKGKKLYDKVKELKFVELIHPQDVSLEVLVDYYRKCDYVLITSRFEGGPMSLVEALASGTKVICPVDIGNAELFTGGIIPYENSSVDIEKWESLYGVLRGLFDKKLAISNLVKHLTWQNFIKELCEVFNALVEK